MFKLNLAITLALTLTNLPLQTKSLDLGASHALSKRYKYTYIVYDKDKELEFLRCSDGLTKGYIPPRFISLKLSDAIENNYLKVNNYDIVEEQRIEMISLKKKVKKLTSRYKKLKKKAKRGERRNEVRKTSDRDRERDRSDRADRRKNKQQRAQQPESQNLEGNVNFIEYDPIEVSKQNSDPDNTYFCNMPERCNNDPIYMANCAWKCKKSRDRRIDREKIEPLFGSNSLYQNENLMIETDLLESKFLKNQNNRNNEPSRISGSTTENAGNIADVVYLYPEDVNKNSEVADHENYETNVGQVTYITEDIIDQDDETEVAAPPNPPSQNQNPKKSEKGMSVLAYQPTDNPPENTIERRQETENRNFKQVKIAESNIPLPVTKICDDKSTYCKDHDFCNQSMYRTHCCRTCRDKGYEVFIDDEKLVKSNVSKKGQSQTRNKNTHTTNSSNSNNSNNSRRKRPNPSQNTSNSIKTKRIQTTSQALRQIAATGKCERDHVLCQGRTHKCKDNLTFQKLCCVTCSGF